MVTLAVLIWVIGCILSPPARGDAMGGCACFFGGIWLTGYGASLFLSDQILIGGVLLLVGGALIGWLVKQD